MPDFLDANWGGWLAGTGVTLVVYALQNWIPKPSHRLTSGIFLFGFSFVCFGVYLLFPQKKDATPSAASPQTKYIVPNTTTAPSLPVPVESIHPRMFIGTLPPNGISSISYAVANASLGNLSDAAVSAWAYGGNGLQKVDEKRIGYIGQGDGRTFERLSSPIPHGKAVLCVSFVSNGKRTATLYFFQSARPYARYGPMHEMQQFREPLVDLKDGALCNSMPQAALRYMND